MMTKEEAMNLVKQVLPCLNIDKKIREAFETLIPELKESEDERIRKALIEVFKEKLERGFEWVEYGIPNRSVLSWLEKQKEQKHANSEKPKEWTDDDSIALKEIQIALSQHCTSENHRRDLCRWLDLHCNAYLLPEKLYQQWKSIKEQKEIVFPQFAESEDEMHRKWILEYLYDGLRKADEQFKDQFKSAIAWLEKQKINTEGDFGRGYDCGYEACLNSHGAEWFEKQKEPHYTKRNALFDKCVENCDPEVMKKVSDEIDEMLQKEQKPFNVCEQCKCPDYNEQKPTEWSEENEKDIAHIIRVLDDCYAYGKHDLSKTDHENLVGTLKSIHPQLKSEWSDEDEGELQNAIDALEFLGKKGVYESESGYDVALKAASWLKSLPERFNPQPKQEWSEEDKYNLNSVINLVHSTTVGAWGSCIGDRIENWLKNLPERFDLSIKQDWSEEDKEKLKAICTYLRDYSRLAKLGDKLRFNEYCDFLESLRPQGSKDSLQPHWKPSEEQMHGLAHAINIDVYDAQRYKLDTLYNDLKKLM